MPAPGSGLKHTVIDSRGVPVRIVAVPFISDGPRMASRHRPGPHRDQGHLGSLRIVLVATGFVGSCSPPSLDMWQGELCDQPLLTSRELFITSPPPEDLTPIQVHSHDELGDLAVSFNNMLSSLSNSRERQKQLIADASHEPRTP